MKEKNTIIFTKKNIKKYFKNINIYKSIQINISKRIGLPNKSNLEDLDGLKIIIKELNKSKKFRITDDNKLSIASSIKYRNIYSEFTSALFLFL